MNAILSKRRLVTISVLLLAVVIIFVPLAASAAPSAATASAPDFAAIDAYVLAQMKSDHIPGVALGIIHGNQIAHLRGFGVGGPAGGAITPQTGFSISSMTKSFTAVAIMQLVEQGKVALDAPVRRYLPWFSVATPGASDTITVRELLNQTSGISHYAGNLALTGTSGETIKQAVQALSVIALSTPPGAAFQYSNLNYVALGLIVEAASGQPYATYLRSHIFAPLGMDSSFTIVDRTPPGEMATGYHWWYGVPVPSAYRNPPDDLPAGGIISSAQDMTHYLIAQLNGGMYAGASLLSPASIAVLHHAVVFPPAMDASYAMGWYDLRVDGAQVLWHSGDDPNFQSDMALLPRSQWGVVVLRNANTEISSFTSPPLFSIPAGVIAMLLGQRPHATGLDIVGVFLLLDALMLLLTLLVVWSTLRLASRWRLPATRTPAALLRGLIVPLLWELALPAAIVFGLPAFAKASWAVSLIFLPDVAIWLLAISALLAITGLARIARYIRPAPKPRHAPPGASVARAPASV